LAPGSIAVVGVVLDPDGLLNVRKIKWKGKGKVKEKGNRR
jgi:hypothetical protein